MAIAIQDNAAGNYAYRRALLDEEDVSDREERGLALRFWRALDRAHIARLEAARDKAR